MNTDEIAIVTNDDCYMFIKIFNKLTKKLIIEYGPFEDYDEVYGFCSERHITLEK